MVTTKKELIDILSRMIWLMTGQHAAVNFPLSDYALYPPNAPTKLYNDSRGPEMQFSIYNLPYRVTSAVRIDQSSDWIILYLKRLVSCKRVIKIHQNTNHISYFWGLAVNLKSAQFKYKQCYTWFMACSVLFTIRYKKVSGHLHLLVHSTTRLRALLWTFILSWRSTVLWSSI